MRFSVFSYVLTNPRSDSLLSMAALGVGGGLTVLCWWQIRLLGDVRHHLGAFYGWFALALLGYVAALGVVRYLERAAGTPIPPPRRWAIPLGLILAVAICSRGLLVGTTPTLSDDIYRYRWDGRVQAAGLNPYAYPPDAPALSRLRDDDFPRINFPHLRTVYPPLTEQAFRLGDCLGQTLIAHKVIFLGVELLTGASLLIVLARRNRSPLWLLAYAWHPLTILEIAGSGHNDALGIAMLWAGLAAWEARWDMAAAVGWALAFLSKYSTVILIPWWWSRRIARGWLVAFCLLSGLPLLLHPTIAGALIESFSAMTGRGSSNASCYLALQALFGVKAAPLIAIGVWGMFLLWWARRCADPVRYLLGGLSAAALLSPALHPWYLLWLIPCFCFERPAALVAFTGMVVLAYTVWPGYLAGGPWQLPTWAHVTEYAPVPLLALWPLGRRWWKKRLAGQTALAEPGR